MRLKKTSFPLSRALKADTSAYFYKKKKKNSLLLFTSLIMTY